MDVTLDVAWSMLTSSFLMTRGACDVNISSRFRKSMMRGSALNYVPLASLHLPLAPWQGVGYGTSHDWLSAATWTQDLNGGSPQRKGETWIWKVFWMPPPPATLDYQVRGRSACPKVTLRVEPIGASEGNPLIQEPMNSPNLPHDSAQWKMLGCIWQSKKGCQLQRHLDHISQAQAQVGMEEILISQEILWIGLCAKTCIVFIPAGPPLILWPIRRGTEKRGRTRGTWCIQGAWPGNPVGSGLESRF